MNEEIFSDCGFSFEYTKIENLPDKYWGYRDKIYKNNPNVIIIGFINDGTNNVSRWKVLLVSDGIVYYNSSIANLSQRTQKFKIPYDSKYIDYYIKKINNPENYNISYSLSENIDIEKSKIKINLKCKVCGWCWNYRLDTWLTESRYDIICPFHNMQYINYTYDNYAKLIYRYKIPDSILILDIVGDHNNINVKSKLHLKCTVCGHDWKSMTINKLIGGRCCINCNNHGYKIQKEAYFYIHSIKNGESIVAYKFGITNNSPHIRCKQINRKSVYDHDIIFEFKDTGDYILVLETHITKSIKTKFLSHNEVRDGWTETISPDDLEKIHDIIVDYLIGK